MVRVGYWRGVVVVARRGTVLSPLPPLVLSARVTTSWVPQAVLEVFEVLEQHLLLVRPLAPPLVLAKAPRVAGREGASSVWVLLMLLLLLLLMVQWLRGRLQRSVGLGLLQLLAHGSLLGERQQRHGAIEELF